MEFLYRAMIEEDGMPKLGASATTLGVRIGKDIETDDGYVHLPDFQRDQKNGVSCSPSVSDLPAFAIPVEWGGRNTRVQVWKIRVEDLGRQLTAEQDGQTHISVGPARTMTFDAYVQAIQSTAPKWELVAAKGSDGNGA